MPLLRVSGPTITKDDDMSVTRHAGFSMMWRPGRQDEQLKRFYRTERLEEVYGWIAEAALDSGWVVQFPYSERERDAARPDRFVKAMSNELKAADAVIAVFSAGDVSTAVETAIASQHGKRQLILYLHELPPRLVIGQVGVQNIAAVESHSQVVRDVIAFLVDGGPDYSGARRWDFVG